MVSRSLQCLLIVMLALDFLTHLLEKLFTNKYSIQSDFKQATLIFYRKIILCMLLITCRVNSGAQIKIAGNEGDESDRLVTITGTPEAVGVAQYLISSR